MTLLLTLRLVIACVVLVIPPSMEENNLERPPSTPHFRSALARTLHSRMLIDERLRCMDWRQEYLLGEAPPPEVLKLFVPLAPDASSSAFVRQCHEGGGGVGGVLLTEVLRSLLSLVLHQTSVNGLLNRGRMFVWSKEQAAVLLRREQHEEGEHHVQELESSSVLQGGNTVLQEHELLAGEHCSSGTSRTGRTSEEQCSTKNTPHPDIAPVHREHRVHSPENTSPENLRTVQEQSKNTVQGEHVLDEEQFFDATDSSFLVHGEQANTVHTVLHVHGEHEEQQEKKPWSGLRLLDVGAGDGHVTAVMADEAASVTVTEISAVMRHRLRQRGYRVLDAHDWPGNDDESYDVITCLNVLDRHPAPRQLLGQLGGKLGAGGRLVLALVLPFAPYVEYDSHTHEPVEQLDITGHSYEQQVTSLILHVLPGLGYRVERWSKVPYMCEGDLEQSIYWLQDAIFVCSKL